MTNDKSNWKEMDGTLPAFVKFWVINLFCADIWIFLNALNALNALKTLMIVEQLTARWRRHCCILVVSTLCFWHKWAYKRHNRALCSRNHSSYYWWVFFWRILSISKIKTMLNSENTTLLHYAICICNGILNLPNKQKVKKK